MCGEFFPSGQDNDLCHEWSKASPTVGTKALPRRVCVCVMRYCVLLNTWPSREVDHAARKDALLFYGDERQAGEDGQRV